MSIYGLFEKPIVRCGRIALPHNIDDCIIVSHVNVMFYLRQLYN